MSILKRDIESLTQGAKVDLQRLLKEAGYTLGKAGVLERDILGFVEKRWPGWVVCLVVGFIIGWQVT